MINIANPWISELERSNLLLALDSTWISSKGEFIDQLENSVLLSERVHNLSVCNGTIALALAYESLLGRSGCNVLVPDMTFAATANAVILSGNIPVFYPIIDDGYSFSPDYDLIEQYLRFNKASAFTIVHLYGEVSCLTKALQFCQQYSLRLIEDCAESPLSYDCNHIQSGSVGDASTFSFFANKVIASGEGGLVSFKDESVYAKARLMRDHGMSLTSKYSHNIVGYNYRMTNLQASIACAQLSRASEIIDYRIKLLNLYSDYFKKYPIILIPRKNKKSFSSPWFAIIKLSMYDPLLIDLIKQNLRDNQIEYRTLFKSLTSQPAFESFHKIGPIDDSLYLNGLMLPLHHKLTDEHIKYICNSVSKVF